MLVQIFQFDPAFDIVLTSKNLRDGGSLMKQYEHVRGHLDYKTFCKICDAKDTSKTMIIRHVEKRHPNAAYDSVLHSNLLPEIEVFVKQYVKNERTIRENLDFYGYDCQENNQVNFIYFFNCKINQYSY